MDLLNFVPLRGFITCDEETIKIVKEAATVIPKVCDILGVEVSFGLDEDETPEQDEESAIEDEANEGTETGNVSEEEEEEDDDDEDMNDEVSSDSDPDDEIGIGNHPMPASPLYQEPSSMSDDEVIEEAATDQTLGTLGHEPTSPNHLILIDEDPIRKKLREDIDTFNNQIRQLTTLEREKNELLKKMMEIWAQNGQNFEIVRTPDLGIAISPPNITATVSEPPPPAQEVVINSSATLATDDPESEDTEMQGSE